METEITTNRAETLKQQSRETAPVFVVREVPFCARQLPNGQVGLLPNWQDSYDMSEAPDMRGTFVLRVAKPHRVPSDPYGTYRDGQCGPELVGAAESAHNLVFAARRPCLGTFNRKDADGGVQ